MRGATKNGVQTLRAEGEFQPTRPLRGATVKIPVTRWEDGISTHAPLAGRDLTDLGQQSSNSNFNPRAPCGARQAGGEETKVFYQHFNPRAPCGARLSVARMDDHPAYFNPRAPCGARLFAPFRVLTRVRISTHAPLAGRDLFRCSNNPLKSNFNPRAPCGARPSNSSDKDKDNKFQPTRPLRGATFISVAKYYHSIFQPTRPLRGATIWVSFLLLLMKYFNPRAPCGARLKNSTASRGIVLFQPTRPLRGATVKVYKSLCTFLR